MTTNKIKLKLKTILPVRHFRNNARTKRSGRTWEQSAGPPDPNNANKTTTGPGHRRTAGEEDRAKAPGRNQPNSPTTAQATCAANSHLGKPKHHSPLVREKTQDCRPAETQRARTKKSDGEGQHQKTVTNCIGKPKQQLRCLAQRFSCCFKWFSSRTRTYNRFSPLILFLL